MDAFLARVVAQRREEQEAAGNVGRRRERLHGTYGSYTAGCRCERCIEANRRYQKHYRRVMSEQERARCALIRRGYGWAVEPQP